MEQRGHDVIPLVRRKDARGIYWNPDTQEIDADSLNGSDAVIHLAGETVAERWTSEKKQRILRSRVGGTKLLVEALRNLPKKPADFLCASAVGFYGERGSEILTEDSMPGTNFLAQVCVDWEAAAASAAQSGIRCSNLRFGIVLSTAGGAFPKILAPFEMGAGGRLGSGKQYMSWIEMRDALSAIEFILSKRALAGPMNIVAPQPVTNQEFTDTLSAVVGRPAIIPIPATMAYLTYGNEMTDQVLLASDRAMPERLSSAGFVFQHGKLEQAMREMIFKRV